MTEVISVKFKNRGKSYFFSPGELKVSNGSKVIVETAKGLEIADCVSGNHAVEDTAVVQPLRPAVRIATAEDLRIAETNIQKEKEAFSVCEQQIAEHGLDMKLVDVEYAFDGSKITFFFTSDGRVDFRELVKDLAGIFRNRIELRQIGVRDEAKLLGGIGICGRPYCCSQFLDDFQPVSTKMAKVQSLSLNPTKISGSCGRLMCCLRYEEDAYENLMKTVPRQGAFVETKDGFGTAVQVNLLRQTVGVKLDADGDDSIHVYKANELCTVPGGRPKDGSAPVSTFVYVPEEEIPEEKEDEWQVYEEPAPSEPAAAEVREAPEEDEKPEETGEKKNRGKSRSRNGKKQRNKQSGNTDKPVSGQKQTEKKEPEKKSAPVKSEEKKKSPKPAPAAEASGDPAADAKKTEGKKKTYHRRFYKGNKNSKKGGGSAPSGKAE